MQNLSSAAVVIGPFRIKFSRPVHIKNLVIWVGLYDSILYIPVNNFSLMSGWVFLG